MMKNNNLDKFSALVSDEKSGWLAKAKWREENQDWLDISFAIAVKILAAFRANKKTDTFPKNQKELAIAMSCTPQYVNKLLKGAENLQLETISKIERILNIKLIEVPENSMINSFSFPLLPVDSFSESFIDLISDSFTWNQAII